MSAKLQSGGPMPEMVLPALGGGEVKLGGTGRWQLVIVYRGKHCPICAHYLTEMEGMKDDFAKLSTEVVAVSCDPKEKAEAHAGELGLSLPVGYDLSIAQARDLGLYVSNPRSAEETDRPFTEPGTFLVNPEGNLHIIDISSAPFARPPLAGLLRGISFIQERNYPIRGTA
ncbi:MAG: peroxiredoxin-like family protein [Kiloniellales bacterium]